MSKSLLTLLSQTEVWLGALGLAAFLAIFWVLRGAPVGQAVKLEDDEDAPRSRYRDRVITAVSVGLLLILTGAYLAFTRGPAWSLPAFVLGFGTVIALVLINQRYRHSSPTLRRTLDVSTAALNASLFAGILIVVNVIAFRYGGRPIDMTSESSYSLSSLTVKQIETLKRPVTFTTFFGKSPMALQQYDRVRELLELYKTANPAMIRIEHINPFTDVPRFESLAKRIPDVDVTQSQGGGIVIEYGEGETADKVVLRNNDLFDIPRDARFNPDVEQFKSEFKGESAVTSALIRLREGSRLKIVFTSGHKEPAIETAGAERSIGVWKARLAATGWDVVAVNLLTEEIPDDTALLVIAGPQTPFKPDETVRLKKYSDKKKPVLILVSDVETTGLEEFLQRFSLALGKGLVFEPRMNYRRPDYLVVPVVGQRHPMVASLNNTQLLFIHASPLKILTNDQNPMAASEYLATPLLRTSPASWVEADTKVAQIKKDPTDESGPVIVGVAVNDRPAKGDFEPGQARLVLFSSGYLADNLSLQIDPENLDLVMNAVNWLRGQPEMEGIFPKSHVSLTLTADPLVRARLILVPTVMSVLLIITLGVTTYLARRD